jgi:hypothetical protein
MRKRYLSMMVAAGLGLASTASLAAVCSPAGASSADAGLAYSADGQVHIFSALTNGNLVRRYGSPGNPAGLTVENLGGVAGSEPSATSWGSGHVATVVRGSNGALWYLQWDNGSFTNWTSLGGTVVWNPSVVATGAGQMTAFYRGSNGQLWYLDYNAGVWGGHQSLSGVLTSSPVAVSSGPGHIAVVTRGQSNDIWLRQRINGVWGPWEGLGGNFASVDPAVASRGPGLVDVFMRGQDNNFYVKSFNGSSWSATWLQISNPYSLGASEPGAVANADGSVTVFTTFHGGGDASHPDTVYIVAKTSADGVNWPANWTTVHSYAQWNAFNQSNPEAVATGYSTWAVASSSQSSLTVCSGP